MVGTGIMFSDVMAGLWLVQARIMFSDVMAGLWLVQAGECSLMSWLGCGWYRQDNVL